VDFQSTHLASCCSYGFLIHTVKHYYPVPIYMKPVTSELKRYIDKNYKLPYEEISTFHFSSRQTDIVNNIHTLIRTAHLDWHNNKQSIEELEHFPKGGMYHDIPENFIRIIEKNLKQQKVFKTSIGNRTINVIFYADAFKSHSPRKWLEYLKKIYIWLTIISQFASNACVNTLSVFIYLTNEKKRLPKDPATSLGRTHANTAFTTSCTSDTEIHLYREEEWFKVFLHETMHSYGLDFSTMENTSANKKIREIFGVSGDVRLYESYAEIWAEIIHICFLSHFEMIDSPILNITSYTKNIEKMLVYEITFSLLQCAKILKHNGLSYDDIAKQDDMSRAKVSKLYKEETPLFSYYVVKSILLFFSNEFIEWTMIHNRGSFNFQKTSQNVDAYIQFIQKHSKNAKYIKTMKMVEECLARSKTNSLGEPSMSETTMRMTLHEE